MKSVSFVLALLFVGPLAMAEKLSLKVTQAVKIQSANPFGDDRVIAVAPGQGEIEMLCLGNAHHLTLVNYDKIADKVFSSKSEGFKTLGRSQDWNGECDSKLSILLGASEANPAYVTIEEASSNSENDVIDVRN